MSKLAQEKKPKERGTKTSVLMSLFCWSTQRRSHRLYRLRIAETTDEKPLVTWRDVRKSARNEWNIFSQKTYFSWLKDRLTNLNFPVPVLQTTKLLHMAFSFVLSWSMWAIKLLSVPNPYYRFENLSQLRHRHLPIWYKKKTFFPP